MYVWGGGGRACVQQQFRGGWADSSTHRLISSWNSPPQIDSPPVPLPAAGVAAGADQRGAKGEGERECAIEARQGKARRVGVRVLTQRVSCLQHESLDDPAAQPQRHSSTQDHAHAHSSTPRMLC